MEPATHPPSEKSRWLSRFQLSLAARVASTFCIALILTSFVTWRIYLNDPRRIPWWDYLHPLQWASLGCLLVTIFASVYWAVRLWKQDYATSDRSLETAWRAGLRAMEKSGRDLSRTPVCLMMGCKDAATAWRIVSGGGCRTAETPVPTGESPLHWIFCEDRVFLHIQSPSLFSEITARLRLQPAPSEAPAMSIASKLLRRASSVPFAIKLECEEDRYHESKTSKPSLVTDQDQNAMDPEDVIPSTISEATNVSPASNLAETISQERNSEEIVHSANLAGGDSNDGAVVTLKPVTESVGSSLGSLFFKESLFHRLDDLQHRLLKAERTNEPSAQSLSPVMESNSESLESHHRSEQRHRELFHAIDHEKEIDFPQTHRCMTPSEERHCYLQLSETMRCLRGLREPVLGINNLLVCLDASHLILQEELAHQAGEALSKDLEVIEEVLGVKAPVHFLVHGMENVDGFSELTRRLGPSASLSQTLGETFPPHRIANEAAIQPWLGRSIRNVVLAAYGGLIGSPTAPANAHHQLFHLVIRMRGRVALSLDALLRGLLSDTKASVPMFSTLAFASSGEDAKDQSFLAPVFSAMERLQDVAGWTTVRLRRESHYRRMTAVAQVISIALTILLVVQATIAVRG
jgi:hypothetical protein